MKLIRTIIIDDERYACERLKKLLTPFTKIQILDYFTDPIKGLEYIIKQKPDLLFLDVELGNKMSAFDLIEQLNESIHKPVVILVTAHPHYSIKAIKYEVFDYILKPVDIDELEQTIARLINHKFITSLKTVSEYNMLSEREKTVLSYVLEGKSSREIADILFISINTVNTHRRNILKKTGAGSSIELLKRNIFKNE